MASVNLQGHYNPPTYIDTRIDVYAFLVISETDVLLVDTGVGAGNDHVERAFSPRRTLLAGELARHGVKAKDVDLVVNSHLHFDHCGNNRMFPDADIYVQQKELDIARTTAHTVNKWFDYDGARLIAVAGDLEIGAGIELLSTPGHTPGHQSVLIRTDDEVVLIAAQAAFTADEYEVYFSHDATVVRPNDDHHEP